MPLDPQCIQFAAREKRSNFFDEEDSGCSGCLFEKERSSVCHAAGKEAKLRGLDDCEAGFIYVAVKIDPRQGDMFMAESS